MKTGSFSRIAILSLVLLGAGWLALYKTRPPAVEPASAPETEFSAARAMKHLAAISQEPHVTGSPELYRVRDYILGELMSLGLESKTQLAVAQNPINDMKVALAENILSVIPGTSPSKAILIIGHYDTPPTSPGAADDGTAVAAMLETARALEAGTPLQNDVVLLFSDAEDTALSGAYAALKDPWLSNVGLVVNLEMRGGGGPVYMFESGRQNGWIIPEFAKAVPYPATSSLMRVVYGLMPNNTDFTGYRDAGYAGFNFGALEQATQYHTPLATVEELDARSIQHHGSYTLGIARHFGNLDLGNVAASDAVYFDLLQSTLIHYPGFLAVPLAILTILLFMLAVVIGLRRGLLHAGGFGRGFMAFLAVLVAGPGAVTLLWFIIRATVNPPVVEGDTYNSLLYLLGFGLLVVAITAALYNAFRRRVSTANLAVGALLWWVVFLLVVTIMFPLANYLFTWPLLFALIGVAYLFSSSGQKSLTWMGVALLSVAGLPGVLLMLPATHQTSMALVQLLSVTGAGLVLLSFLLGLLVPHLAVMAASNSGLGRWWLPVGSAALGIVVLIVAMATVRADARHPRVFHLIYGLDADTGETMWASIDSSKFSREWSGKFFSEQATREPLPQFFGLDRPVFLIDRAPAAPLSPPEIVVLEDTQAGDVRNLRLSVTSTRGATHVKFYVEAPTQVLSAAINGEPIKVAENPPERGEPWELRYWGPLADGMELSLEVTSQQAIQMRVVEVAVGLPESLVQSIAPRPDDMTSFTCWCRDDGDMTLITSALTFR